MNQTKLRFITLTALMLALALVLSFAFGSLAVFGRAYADYRPTEIFSVGTGATIDTTDSNEGDFVPFTFNAEDGKIYFRRDLALKWYAPHEADAEEETPAPTHDTKYYSMTFAFPTIDFTTFSVVYESAEENITKDSKATNSIVFFAEEGSLKAALRNSSEQLKKDEKKEDDWAETADKKVLGSLEGEETVAGQDIVIRFSEEVPEDTEALESGEFAVYVNDIYLGNATNIGGYFMEYLSSASSTPRDPITFRLDKLADGKTTQKLTMKALNGQTFELSASKQIVDNADPALVINEAVYAYTLGRKWSLSYEAIDVCKSSVTVTRKYAMVEKADENERYPKPVEADYDSLTTSTVFMPTSDGEGSETQYVSIYFELSDGRTLSDDAGEANRLKEAKRVFLSWYAADENQTATLASSSAYVCPTCGFRVNVEEFEELPDDWKCTNTEAPEHKNAEGEPIETAKADFELKDVEDFEYIIVNRGDTGLGTKKGPEYVGVTVEDSTDDDGNPIKINKTSEESEKQKELYQEAVRNLTEEVVEKDGTTTRKLLLSAGDGSYFYLPSLRGLIKSENADYRNLRFSIYYKKQSHEVDSSASSATSLRYNALRFEIDEEGVYVFKILASDAAGNAMQYAVDGKLVAVSSSNIWDIEEIPEFTFEVTYTGATIEKPGTQSLGYRESTYDVDSFDIVALDGYKTQYTLYRFDASKLKPGQERPTYSSFVENAKQYATEDYKDCLIEIHPFDDTVSEDDTDRWNRTDNKYHWDPESDLSFVPQEATYYVVKLVVTEESRRPGHAPEEYQVIDVQNPIDPRPDKTYWLENNITSVVLFSVSAVLLVIIVILFVVKPSDKNIEEVDVSTLRGGKKNKKKEE